MDSSRAQDINKSRAAFIKAFQMQHGGKKVLKHIKQVNEQDLPADCVEFHKSKVKGDEICIEYHHFEVFQGPKKGMQVLGQWRLRPANAE
jgi:hypothetical protein